MAQRPVVWLALVTVSLVACASATTGPNAYDLSAAVPTDAAIDARESEDATPVVDGATMDLVARPDLVVPPDMVLVPDLVPPRDLMPIPDLVPPPDFVTYMFIYQQTGTLCPAMPANPGTVAVGDPCSSAMDCKGFCCKCSASASSYFGNACIGSKCADLTPTCNIIESKVTSLCH